MQRTDSPPTIIDLEASGFGAASYPIEIGVARSDGARFCRLIRPYDDWTHWDTDAEALHGLSRQHLCKYGLPGEEVCRELNSFLGRQTAYSDGWVVDYPWMLKLFAASRVNMTFRFSALEYVLTEAQMTHWKSVKSEICAQLPGHRHRASIDAELIQQTFIRTASVQPVHRSGQRSSI
ncbi:hypothetical protein DXV75_04030 [Alteromonas aestuariivivens]|uniref:Exonuclease domain-containing protein n=1 Tax=Alteromonas aestuariivivens TaxID=1938339 RepID=A0A3D8MD31_9ALTE|nr:hypothetical protein [Alteromonas aestuariivivens]RDV28139.1 hypothetical protein DXV75_04030 [Alteromonas aestuariivivens]